MLQILFLQHIVLQSFLAFTFRVKCFTRQLRLDYPGSLAHLDIEFISTIPSTQLDTFARRKSPLKMKSNVHSSAGEFDSGHGSMPKPPSAQLFQIHKHDKIYRNTSTFYLGWEFSIPLKVQSRARVRHWIYMVGAMGCLNAALGSFSQG